MAIEKQLKLRESTPAQRIVSPIEEMERFFESAYPSNLFRPFRWGWPEWSSLSALEPRVPKIDVIDREDEFLVKAEVPGVSKKDLDITMSDHSVTFKCTTNSESKKETGEYYRREMAHGEFSRTITLPGEVDSDKAHATFRDGIVELVVPKLEKSQRHSIPID